MVKTMIKTRTTPSLIEGKNYYCAGCGHSIVVRLICEVVEEMGLMDRTVYVRGVGCRHTKFNHIQAPHGRACAMATGVSRSLPDLLTLTFQGDGDAYTIGLSETFNAAYRNENFAMIVVNNCIFGMTGGQMAHTTLEGEVTTTSPYGRDCSKTGQPLRFPEILAQNFDNAFVARGSVFSPAEVNRTKSYIRKAFEKQQAHEGFSLVEVLVPCPTNWGMAPLDALKKVETTMAQYYPIGVLHERGQQG